MKYIEILWFLIGASFAASPLCFVINHVIKKHKLVAGPAPKQEGLTITIRTEVPGERYPSVFVQENGKTMKFSSMGFPDTKLIREMVNDARARFATGSA